MTASNWDRSLQLLFISEGGYVDNPADPGGATNLGITQSTLASWRGHAVSKADVKALTRAEAGLIYHKRYGAIIRFDELPSGVDYCLVDWAVNSGPGTAAKHLQAVLGIHEDGVIGSQTLAAVSHEDPIQLVNDLCDERLAWLKTLSTWQTFGKGWAARVARVRADALKMAGTTVPAAYPGTSPTVPMPPPPDIEKPDVKSTTTPSLWGAIVNILRSIFAALGAHS